MFKETYKVFYTGKLEVNFNLGTIEPFQSSVNDFIFKVHIPQFKEEFLVSFASLYVGDLELTSDDWLDLYVRHEKDFIQNIKDSKGRITCYKSAKLSALAKQNLENHVFTISIHTDFVFTGRQILDLLNLH